MKGNNAYHKKKKENKLYKEQYEIARAKITKLAVQTTAPPNTNEGQQGKVVRASMKPFHALSGLVTTPHSFSFIV